MSATSEAVKKSVKAPIPAHRSKKVWTQDELIPTGSTLLNLACTDTMYGGYGHGKMVNLIGDSSSGKTILALTMLACMTQEKRFDDYEFIYHDSEVALEFDIEYMFGPKVAKRIIMIENKNTIQDWYVEHLNRINNGVPFVYVTDSFDGIGSNEESKRGQEMLKKALRKKEGGKEEKDKGSYSMEKQKWASEAFRQYAEGVAKTNSIDLIICQTRDKIGAMFGPKKTKSGGTAMKFWMCHEIWLSHLRQIQHDVRKRVTGNEVMAKITKNKLTGKVRKVTFPVYYEHGLDDIESCVNFLKEEKHWKTKTGKGLVIPEFDLEDGISKDDFIQLVHDDIRSGSRKMYDQLREVTRDVWMEIEEEVTPNRMSLFV